MLPKYTVLIDHIVTLYIYTFSFKKEEYVKYSFKNTVHRYTFVKTQQNSCHRIIKRNKILHLS